MLDEREASAGRPAVEHEAHPDAAEEAGLAIPRPDHACGGRRHRHLHFVGHRVPPKIATGVGLSILRGQPMADQTAPIACNAGRSPGSGPAFASPRAPSRCTRPSAPRGRRSAPSQRMRVCGDPRSTVTSPTRPSCSTRAPRTGTPPPPASTRGLGRDRGSRRTAARRGRRALRLLRHVRGALLGNLYRDELTVPLVRERFAAFRSYVDAARDTLVAGRPARGARGGVHAPRSRTPSRSRRGSRSCRSRGSRTRTQARSCAPWWRRPDRSAGKGVADRLGGRRLEPDVGRQRREDGIARLVLALGAIEPDLDVEAVPESLDDLGLADRG